MRQDYKDSRSSVDKEKESILILSKAVTGEFILKKNTTVLIPVILTLHAYYYAWLSILFYSHRILNMMMRNIMHLKLRKVKTI